MALAAGQYEGRVGGRVYDTRSLGALAPIQPVHETMTAQRAQQMARKRQRLLNAQNRQPPGGDQRFWHQTQRIERSSDMVLLGRTSVQTMFSANANKQQVYQRHMVQSQTFAVHPVHVAPIPHETEGLVLTGLGTVLAGLCLGALVL